MYNLHGIYFAVTCHKCNIIDNESLSDSDKKGWCVKWANKLFRYFLSVWAWNSRCGRLTKPSEVASFMRQLLKSRISFQFSKPFVLRQHFTTSWFENIGPSYLMFLYGVQISYFTWNATGSKLYCDVILELMRNMWTGEPAILLFC